MSNLLEAISNIYSNPVTELKSHYSGRNTMNNMGEALETFIQDAFSDSINEQDPHKRKQNISNTFSYLGNQNNPPDMIVKNGDAIEVKKIQLMGATIALNSSHPKDKLYKTDPKINQICRDCEEWSVKDLIYTIGVTSDTHLKHLWLVYGDCYAADKSIYTRIANSIKNGIEEIPDIEFKPTKELGRVNRVDPLGITNLRIRGMWGIQNPMNVYSDIYSPPDDSSFSLAALVSTDKYNSFPEKSRSVIENNKSINISDIEIKDPNNPAKLIKAKLITYTQL